LTRPSDITVPVESKALGGHFTFGKKLAVLKKRQLRKQKSGDYS
jgi:hypothetical protein